MRKQSVINPHEPQKEKKNENQRNTLANDFTTNPQLVDMDELKGDHHSKLAKVGVTDLKSFIEKEDIIVVQNIFSTEDFEMIKKRYAKRQVGEAVVIDIKQRTRKKRRKDEEESNDTPSGVRHITANSHNIRHIG